MELTPAAYNFWTLILQLLIWVAMIATFIVYYRQLRAMRESATGQNILSLVQLLQAPDVRQARETVRKHLKGKPLEQWSEDEKRDAAVVCATYDVASILIFQQRLVPPEPFVTNWGASIIDCYDVCLPYVKAMQMPENSGPNYWNDFAQLAKASRR